jgi:acetolactate synthase I/II/III large subunit
MQKAWGTMTGAEGVVDCLRRAGVTRVFGIPSADSNELFAALRRSPIDVVLSTNEPNASFMADAHARVTGELGACLLGPGPGLMNAMNGIALARVDASPVFVLVAGAPTQGFDSLSSAEPICKGVFRIREAAAVPLTLARAVRLAQEQGPGPVLVEVPRDVLLQTARMEGTGFRVGPWVMGPEVSAALEQAVERVKKAQRVGIYAGAGCISAAEELMALAERLQAPVATTLSGLGVLPSNHPLVVGFGLGKSGAPFSDEVFQKCDLVVAVSCKFHETTIKTVNLNPTKTIVHIDADPHVVGVGVPQAIGVAAPAKHALRFLLDRVGPRGDAGFTEQIRLGKKAYRQALAARPEWKDAVDPVKFFIQLRDLLSTEDILVLDSGRHAFYGVASYPVLAPRTLLMPVDHRAIGFSIPAAVAANLARPEARVVGCIGDGGLLHTGFELLTARRCNVSPVVVVFSDDRFDDVHASHERMLGREVLVGLVPVNYQELAKAFGLGYVRIQRDSELKLGLQKALTMEKPVLVELRVAYREPTPFLKEAVRAEWKRLPRSAALRLGVRLIMKKLFGRR